MNSTNLRNEYNRTLAKIFTGKAKRSAVNLICFSFLCGHSFKKIFILVYELSQRLT